MKNERSYYEKCFELYQNGGTLWLIERTDTGEFLKKDLKIFNSADPSTFSPSYRWSNKVSVFTVFFLSKADAENELKYLPLTECGCQHCGNGSKPIPIKITDHEFLTQLSHGTK